jgi:uncharacterized membrane protein
MWLIPALVVLAATAIIGAVRYPGLPSQLAVHFGASGVPDRWVRKSAWSAFAMVVGQLWVTALWAGLVQIIYRSRPDIDATDAADSTRRYRRFLAACTRALLVLVALVDVSLMLAALRRWQVYRLSGIGSALLVLPPAAGLLILVAVIFWMGQARSRLTGTSDGRRPPADANRDDDRFWKAGLTYANRDDPAVMVGARFGVGWTLNFGNPIAWLIVGAIVVVAAGLAVIRAFAGM